MSQNSNKDESPTPQKAREIYDVEILGPEDDRQTGGSRRFYRRVSYGGGNNINGVWTWTAMDGGGCATALVTLVIFLCCLVQYGALAAIGFIFFHIIGSVLGSFYAAQKLVAGLPWNPWPWRIGNWLVSFLLTVWLAS